jgi:predicted RNA-binding protein
MPEIMNFDPPETESKEYLGKVTDIMSPRKDLDVNRDDLYEEVVTQIPEDFRVIYSIEDGEYNDGASLRAIVDGQDEEIEVKGKVQNKLDMPRHKISLRIGSLVIDAQFKEQRSTDNPNVKSGYGSIFIYKQKEN